MWSDVACIVFACVTANHLGLIEAIQTVTKCNRLPVLSCPKCLAFWSVLTYGLWGVSVADIPEMLALSFIASYMAVWLELLEGLLDTLYMKIYEKIINPCNNDTLAADSYDRHTTGSVS